MKPLTILSVGFPLVRVSRDAVGGSEQILSQIDEGLVARGHRSIVIAPANSEIRGELLAIPAPNGNINDAQWRLAHDYTRRAIARALEKFRVDLVHMHGVDFCDYLPRADVPVLATLHLPLAGYKPGALACPRPRTFFHCVSRAQRALAPAGARLLPEIENGVREELFAGANRFRKRGYAAALGRICPEKGFDIALRAARAAGTGMLLAGRIFPFAEHERYFAEKIAPELDAQRRFIGPVALRAKKRLLSCAQCVLVTSLVPETSSLVAREALACGTPVVGFARGALPELILHGRTGFLVRSKRDLPEAIRVSAELDAEECRAFARERFSAARMVDRYIEAYRRILAEPVLESDSIRGTEIFGERLGDAVRLRSQPADASDR